MMTLHKEGIATLTIAGILLAGIYFLLKMSAPFALDIYIIIAGAFYLFLMSFFRKPDRTVFAADSHEILAPADGKIVVIEEVYEEEYLKQKCMMVSIFMSPLNVHINWYPCPARVKYTRYHPGKYLAAWNPKSSLENERTTLVLETSHGEILLRQVAGALARRIVQYATPGQEVYRGQEMGFIKFGSRVDIYLPLDAKIAVALDQVVKGNQTTIASLV